MSMILLGSLPLALVTNLSQVHSAPPGRSSPRPVASLGIFNTGLAGSALFAAQHGHRVAMAVLEDAQNMDLDGDGNKLDDVLFLYDSRTGTTSNTGLAVKLERPAFVSARVLAVARDEGGSSGGVRYNEDFDTIDEVPFLYDVTTGALLNTRRQGGILASAPGRLIVYTMEDEDGRDWNGDGDRSDDVVDLYRVDDLEAVGLALAPTSLLQRRGRLPGMEGAVGFMAPPVISSSGEAVAITVDEPFDAGLDHNGDGDGADHDVVHLFQVASGSLRNVGIAGNTVRFSGNEAIFRVTEGSTGVDLNGDGDALDAVAHSLDVTTLATSNLGYAAQDLLYLGDGHAGFPVSELQQGNTDLNGDGDTGDFVLFTHELSSGTTVNLGLAVSTLTGVGSTLIFGVFEGNQADLNGDGDKTDIVFHTYEGETGVLTNLAVAQGWMPAGGERFALLLVSESGQNVDYTGDGDKLDRVYHVYDAASGTLTNTGKGVFSGAGITVRELGSLCAFQGTEGNSGADWNGDGDQIDTVLFFLDGDDGTTINTGLAVPYLSNDVHAGDSGMVVTVYESSQSMDLNGDGDRMDYVYHVLALP